MPALKPAKRKSSCREVNGRGGRRRNVRNPDEQIQAAAALSEQFHGRPAKTVKHIEQEEAEYPALAQLGTLIELRVKTAAGTFQIPFRDSGVLLCATPDGRNLHLIGGDQSFDLASLGIESDKDQLPLGACTHVVYHTRKGFDQFVPLDYIHKQGEAGGEPPLLEYSQINQRFYFSGGTYTVKPEGIVN